MFQKGNKEQLKGSKGNKGTKTKAEVIEKAKEAITKEALAELSRSLIGKRLNSMVEQANDSELKDFALPIVLKDMVAKMGNPDGTKFEFISIYAGRSLQGQSSNSQDILPNEENQGSSRGNECEQDNIDSDLAD
jgi:hypothetical protein